MHNRTTHYQTSFKVSDPDGEALMRLKAAAYGWILQKEPDRILRNEKMEFFFRGHWPNLLDTHSAIITDTYRNDKEGDCWAIHYREVDKDCGRKRFWYSDIGFKKEGSVVIVSVRISFAWNTEYLSHEPDAPTPTVPQVVRYMLRGNHVFSGRPEFKLIEKPIQFKTAGMGKVLCDFIQSPERRYPLIVFNGNLVEHVREAELLGRL